MASHSVKPHRYLITPLLHDDIADAYAIFEQTHDNPWSLASFQESVATSHCLIAKTRGINDISIKGIMLFQITFDQADVLFIGVVQNNRRSGIATQLIQAAIHTLQEHGVASVFLEVDKSNSAASAFYENIGFQCINIRKNYYQKSNGSQSDALIMRRGISPANTDDND
ncbi:MAG: ribosomal protein S18-alanine N-acetyltransferase [Pseudomonadota bacterium]